MPSSNHSSCTILAPGFAKWRGSDGRALAQAFRRLGHKVIEIDEEDFVPFQWQSTTARVLRRLFLPVFSNDYNRAVLEKAANCPYDFVVAYKGYFLKRDTIRILKERGKPVFNFYPDVSFEDHGPHIPNALALYDCVFTTKSYHGQREIEKFGIKRLQHVRHGFDPDVHRPLVLSNRMLRDYACDVSFVGCWSREKENRLLYLLRQAPDLSVRVYGVGWNYASAEFKLLIGGNLRSPVFGDELVMVYQASKINLGLLSSSKNSQLRDQTTARSFQIPAARSFMLHENTPEIKTYFETEEVLLFDDNDDMVAKVRLALSSDSLRDSVRRRGYERCVRDGYNYQPAAETIISYFQSLNPSFLVSKERKSSEDLAMLTH